MIENNNQTQTQNMPVFLHKNLEITSDKQRSSQGSVFYFKFNKAQMETSSSLTSEDHPMMGSSDLDGEEKQIECILKIVRFTDKVL